MNVITCGLIAKTVFYKAFVYAYYAPRHIEGINASVNDITNCDELIWDCVS